MCSLIVEMYFTSKCLGEQEFFFYWVDDALVYQTPSLNLNK